MIFAWIWAVFLTALGFGFLFAGSDEGALWLFAISNVWMAAAWLDARRAGEA